MPTGTGKTETMLSVLAAYRRDPMLVVVPSDALRLQTAAKFLSFGLLRKLGVLDAAAPNPIVGIVTKVPKNPNALDIFERCNVIVGTMDSLADRRAETLWPEIAKRVGVVINNEAHHVAARRWSNFREAFETTPVLQFTATPFRRDGNLVDGQVIFNYTLGEAQSDGYLKPIVFDPVFEDSVDKADEAIADAALATLRNDLDAGLDHLMMARCASISRATDMVEIYRRLDPELNPILVHSTSSDATQRIAELKARDSRVVVCVNMLGEGFDLPPLKVAAIHDLHKSLAILLQFTGRFTRSAAPNIGDATVIANIADPNVSAALERLYSEDADWNELLSEMSSEAASDHAKLTRFLNEAQRLDEETDSDAIPTSHKLLKPTLSTLVFEADDFAPTRFFEGLPKTHVPYRVWLHDQSHTLFFVTVSEPTVKWSRSKAVKDRVWTLFVLHHDPIRKLLYLSSSDHTSTFEPMARAVGASRMLNGDVMFRSMGRISRLIFQNIGVRKHGRRNLSYASYTGAEVAEALSQAEKAGSVKAMLSGMGWEGGQLITVGGSAKGRVWSRENGTIPRFNEWYEGVSGKLIDTTIDTSKLIDHVLLPLIVTELPEAEVLCVEWPIELLRQAEESVDLSRGEETSAQTTFELSVIGVDWSANVIDFRLMDALTGPWGDFRFSLGSSSYFRVDQTSEPQVDIKVGRIQRTLQAYLSDYPPLFRFVDLSELDGNLHIVPQTPYDLRIEDERFQAWDWTNIDIKNESIWKGDVRRDDSIQGHVASQYVDAGFGSCV